MAIYEYYCGTCKTKFEQRKSMADVAVATTCANGHEAERLISSFAVGRTGNELSDLDIPQDFSGGGGGCCGGAGGCACSSMN